MADSSISAKSPTNGSCRSCERSLPQIQHPSVNGTGVCFDCGTSRIEDTYREIPAARRWLRTWTDRERSYRRVVA